MFRRKKEKRTVMEDDTLRSLKNTLKGYEGYDNVKHRSQSDKSLRNYLYDLVITLINSYSKVQNQLMVAQLLSTWSASNQILSMLNSLRTLLTSDVYRHSTFFETPNVHENIEISILYLLESETILEMRALEERMEEISRKLTDLDLFNIEKDVIKIRNDIDEVQTTISDRAELIASFEIVGL